MSFSEPSGVDNLMWPWQRTEDKENYSIYTTEFDVELNGDELGRALTPKDREIWQEQIDAFEIAVAPERTKAGLNSLAKIDKVLTKHPGIGSTTTVSVVVDHSGSLRGQRAIIACLLVQMIGEFLGRLGVKFELLGFTTAAWQGGQSRMLWLARGQPQNPGRLNDLMHICYREASNTNPGAPWSVYNLLRDDLLKENIDGEAVFWAAERLKNLNADQNLIIVISDGAPVDDSTLNENAPDILWQHLKGVISDVSSTPGFRIAGIGIDYDVSSLYPMALKVDRLDQISVKLPEFLQELFE